MGGESLLNFGPNQQFNPTFKVEYEVRGDVFDWISKNALEVVKKFIDFSVDILNINSTWSKYKKLLIVLEETESENLDGVTYDNDQQGIVKIFLYDLVQDIRKLLETIAHELVHVRQFCDKRLSHLFKRVNGQIVGCYNWSETGELYYGEDDVSSYRSLPWEIEAFNLQEKIVDAFELHLRAMVFVD